MSRFAQVSLAVARKELVTEWRSREILPSLAQFIVLALVIANFGFDIQRGESSRTLPGILWLTLIFVLLLAVGRSFAGERDQGSLEALLLTPASRAAIFMGKAAAAFALLLCCELVLLPALGLFLGAPVLSAPLWAAVLLATIGLAVAGCLFAALAAQTRGRELLLPVLLLPLCLPLVIVGGRVAQLAMGASGTLDLQPFGLLLDFDILFLVAGGLAARYVLDD